jgi:hypothetical protein
VKLKLLLPTKTEIREVTRHYESLSPGLAVRILIEVQSKFDFIRHNPEGYQVIEIPLRRVELSTVPYQLYYAVVDEVAPILGFVPARLHPSRKHQLLKDRLTAWNPS